MKEMNLINGKKQQGFAAISPDGSCVKIDTFGTFRLFSLAETLLKRDQNLGWYNIYDVYYRASHIHTPTEIATVHCFHHSRTCCNLATLDLVEQ